MRLAAHGIRADLPSGWEGQIRRQADPTGPLDTGEGPRNFPVAHLTTVGLPPEPGDFGGNVVHRLDESDVLVSLLEYGPDVAGTALFATPGLPRHLDVRAFSPRGLQRHIHGQAGLQIFFTDNGRPFCLYAVLGSTGRAPELVRRIEDVLSTVVIEAAP